MSDDRGCVPYNVYMASLSTERNKRVNGSKITLRMHFYFIFHLKKKNPSLSLIQSHLQLQLI